MLEVLLWSNLTISNCVSIQSIVQVSAHGLWSVVENTKHYNESQKSNWSISWPTLSSKEWCHVHLHLTVDCMKNSLWTWRPIPHYTGWVTSCSIIATLPSKLGQDNKITISNWCCKGNSRKQCNDDDYIHIWIKEHELQPLSSNFLMRAFYNKLYLFPQHQAKYGNKKVI